MKEKTVLFIHISIFKSFPDQSNSLIFLMCKEFLHLCCKCVKNFYTILIQFVLIRECLAYQFDKKGLFYVIVSMSFTCLTYIDLISPPVQNA